MLDYGAASSQIKQSAAPYGDDYATEKPVNGLMRIAEQISENAMRVNQIASMLQQVSMGIHGPRPEPVSGERAGVNAPQSDSLASRVQSMSDAVNQLQRVYESIIR